jgi:hypothetical protein
MVDVLCEGCGKSFSIKPWRLNRAPVRFCSTACRVEGQYLTRQPNSPEIEEARERELEEARRMRADGMGWETIGRHFGRGKDYFRISIDPNYKEILQQRRADERAKYLAKKTAAALPAAGPPDLPDAIVAEIREKHARGYKLTAIPALLSVRGVRHDAVAAALGVL